MFRHAIHSVIHLYIMKKENDEKIPHRNRSHSGWWITSVIMRFEYYDEDKNDLKRKCKVWDNLTLIEANDRDEAYDKAIECGKVGENEAWDEDTGRRGRWQFEGLGLLLPVYDNLENGAEVLWTEHEDISVEESMALVLPKLQLGCFDDNPNE